MLDTGLMCYAVPSRMRDLEVKVTDLEKKYVYIFG